MLSAIVFFFNSSFSQSIVVLFFHDSLSWNTYSYVIMLLVATFTSTTFTYVVIVLTSTTPFQFEVDAFSPLEHFAHLCKFCIVCHLVSIQTIGKEFEPTWLNPHNCNFYVMDSFFLFSIILLLWSIWNGNASSKMFTCASSYTNILGQFASTPFGMLGS